MNTTSIFPIPSLKSVWFLAVMGCGHAAIGTAATIDLGAASNFAILAGTAITNTGATQIKGDMGTFSGTAVTGIGDIDLEGVNHGAGPATQAARASFLTAFAQASALPADFIYPPIAVFGDETLTPGVYFDSSSFAVTGVLTLDGLGDPNASWVFQMGSTLTTAVGSRINLINGADAGNVVWKVGSSATLGTGSQFAGTILAWDSITFDSAAMMSGKALAYNGAVTMIGNTVIPEPAAVAFCGLAALGAISRRRR